MKIEDLDPDQRAFLQELDGMIESTEEFIADDQIEPEHDEGGRHVDLACLNHTRATFSAFYDLEDGGQLTNDERALERNAATAVVGWVQQSGDAELAQRMIDQLQPLADQAGRS